jgi:hypothetical protein
VTVEISSPVLIEKVRTATTDANGQYRVVDLRPGTYALHFQLAGFATVQRTAIELTGSLAATVNAEMRVGGVEETVTVTGESPIVDVQQTGQQRTIASEVVEALPTGRTVHNVVTLIPGISITVTGSTVGQDVGGSTAGTGIQSAAIHGGRPGDQRVMVEGAPINGGQAGNTGGFSLNPGSSQEITVDTSVSGAEEFSGGVRINVVPKQGGNSFSGNGFATGATSAFQSSNFDADLAARGFRPPDPPKTLKMTLDLTGALGGPIVRDRMWFFAATNWHHEQNLFPLRENLNAGDPNAWLYVPDPTGDSVFSDATLRSVNGRVTWQATAMHKFAAFIDEQKRCICPDQRTGIAPDAARDSIYHPSRLATVSWTAPLKNSLLVEAAWIARIEGFGQFRPDGSDPNLIGVNDTGLGLTYRAPLMYQDNSNQNYSERGSLSYITGAHAFKTGFSSMQSSYQPMTTANNSNTSYIFANGVPTSITLYATPTLTFNKMRDLGIYAQDRWTLRRATLSLGVRYDQVRTFFPAQELGPAPLVPDRHLSTPATEWVSWKDITPRLGVAYDVFGNGRTAVKGAYNKFLATQGSAGNFGSNGNPLNRVPSTTTRSWADADRDFVPDCVITNFAANGECGPIANAAFGTAATDFNADPDLLKGWGKRGFNWEASLSVAQQLTNRISVEGGYFRRWYGNFTVSDNVLVTPADFTRFSVPLPNDPDLPLSGQTLSNLYDVNPNRFGQVNNLLTLVDGYGNQVERWHGFDGSVNVRAAGGLVLQGGFSTGSTLLDSCEVREALPESAPLNPFCRSETPFLTQVKGFASYTIPKVAVQASLAFQNMPGAPTTGVWQAPNAVIEPSLGRPLSGNARVAAITVVEPGTMYLERLNQLDVRFGKLLRFGRYRTNINMDLFNVLNDNAVLVANPAFGPAWLTPQAVLPGRLLKVSGSFDF